MNPIEAAEVARDNYFQALYDEVRPVVQEFLEKQDTFAVNEANTNLISRWIAQQGKLASHAWIVSAIQVVGDSLVRKPVPVPLEGEELRQSVIAQILTLVKSSPGETQRLTDSFKARYSLSRDEVNSTKHTGAYCITTESLIQKLTNLREDQRLRSLSHEELKAEVASKKKTFTYPPLPSDYTPFQISQMSAEHWKKTVALYGVDQLNARLAKQKAAGEWKGMKITGE
jgi:hypothetical protein